MLPGFRRAQLARITWRLSLLGAMSLVACEPAPTPLSPTARAPELPATTASAAPAASAEASAAPAASAVAMPPLPELPPAIDLPGKRSCTFKTLKFVPAAGGNDLSFKKGGPVFARVIGGDVVVSLPNGTADVALLEARSDGVQVSGIVDARRVDVRPTTAFVMAGFLVPNPSTELSIVSAEDDTISVRLTLPDSVVAANKTVEETRPCGDLGFDQQSFVTKSPVFGERNGSTMELAAGATRLSLKPTGPSIATLRVQAPSAIVFAFATEQGRTLISWQTPTALVFGWVSSSRLTPVSGGSGSSHDGLLGRIGPRAPKPIAFVQCDADVPLIAEVKDEARTVGKILSGTTIGVAAWGTERATLSLPMASISAASEGHFAARTAELRTCREVAAKPKPSP